MARDFCTYGSVSNLVPLVNIKIAGKWMFIPLKMVLIGIDPYPYQKHLRGILQKSILLSIANTPERKHPRKNVANFWRSPYYYNVL